ncbi:MAG: lysophospholipid acyltransferase family protein [Chloroflexota bacterium]
MSSFRTRLIGNGLYLLSQMTRRTARYHVSGRHHFERSRADDTPTVWVAWHGMTMMLAGFVLQNYDAGSLVIMMPDDWRGEALGHWARRLGATPWQLNLKGDTSMATARRLAAMLRLLREGCDAYVTPDGPDGPAYKIKPGVAYLAQKSGATLLPIGAYTRRGHRLNRWDRYVVPYPFSRIAVVIGSPITVPGDVELADITEPLTDVLHRVTAQAAANYYEADE